MVLAIALLAGFAQTNSSAKPAPRQNLPAIVIYWIPGMTLNAPGNNC